MKIRLIIILLIIGAIVVHYFIGMDYMTQRRQQETLASEITDVTQELAQAPKPPADLEERLAAAEASFAAEQSGFPGELNSTHIVNTILELADLCEVKAIPIITQPWAVESFGQGYEVFRLSVVVKGSLPKLINFLNKLENGELKTLMVKSMSLHRLDNQPLGDTVIEENRPIYANLEIAIYTQSLTSD